MAGQIGNIEAFEQLFELKETTTIEVNLDWFYQFGCHVGLQCLKQNCSYSLQCLKPNQWFNNNRG